MEEEYHYDRAVKGRDGRSTDAHGPPLRGAADAAVLGWPTLRDVQLRHDLDAGGDRRLQPPGRRFLIVEQPVDAIADAQTVLERFDVDVRGLGGQRAIDEQIDQTDHRGLEGRVAEVIDILTLVTLSVWSRRSHPLDNLLERGVGPAGPLDGLQDRLSRRHAELDRAAQRLAQIIAKHRIGGVGRWPPRHTPPPPPPARH